MRKPADAQPKSMPVEAKDFQSRAAAIAEDEDGPRCGVLLKFLAAKRDQRVDSFAEIDGLAGEQDRELRQKLDHGFLGAQKIGTEPIDGDQIERRQGERKARAVGPFEQQARSGCGLWR